MAMYDTLAMPSMTLFEGERTRLRAVERTDLPLIHKWQNDMEVMQNLWQSPVSLARLEREFDEELSGEAAVTRRFIIEMSPTGVEGEGHPIGLIWYHNMNRANRSCTLGIYIGDKERWGHGLGTDAIRAFLRYLFLVENMHYVGLSYVEGNGRGQGAYEKCGFVKEGVSRKWCFISGEYHDLVHMSILEDEFNG